MYWLVLVGSGLFEAVWATALSRSEGFTRPLPVIIFFLSCGISMAGLAYALKEIPVGTGYAIWVAVGAATTVCYAAITGAEPMSVVKALLLMGLIGCVIGLKLVSE